MEKIFYNYKNLVILILSMYLLMFCKKEKTSSEVVALKSIINQTLGKKLNLPNELELYEPFSEFIIDSSEIANSKLKIYTHINASCESCISKIKLWNSLAPTFSEYKIKIIIICSSKDNFELINHLIKSGEVEDFAFPLFFDLENKYLNLNGFMNEVEQFETVLTDTENNILLMGNPIYSNEMKDLYLKEIQKRINVENDF